MSEFEIGSKWIYEDTSSSYHNQEVELVGYVKEVYCWHNGIPREILIRCEGKYIISVTKSSLKPIPPKPEFEIGSKWLYMAFSKYNNQEVEIVGYNLGNDLLNIVVRFNDNFVTTACKSQLKPIPTKPEFKVGQEVWVKGRILEIDEDDDKCPFRIKFDDFGGGEWIGASAEIKPCKPEPNYDMEQKSINGNFVSLTDAPIDPRCRVVEEPLEIGDRVRVEFEGFLTFKNEIDDSYDVRGRNGKLNGIWLKPEFITKIKK